MEESQDTQKEIPTQVLSSKIKEFGCEEEFLISNKIQNHNYKTDNIHVRQFQNDDQFQPVAKLSHSECKSLDIIFSGKILNSKNDSCVIGVDLFNNITRKSEDIVSPICQELNENLLATCFKFLFVIKSLSNRVTVYVNDKDVNIGASHYLYDGDKVQLENETFYISIFLQKNLIVEAETQQFSKEIKNEYIFIQKAGSGNFATVWLSINKLAGKEYACKIINKKKQLLKSGMSNIFEREVSLMKKLSHPNIVKCWNVFTDSQRIYIFMEYMAGGDLLSYVLEYGALCEDESKIWFCKIANALRYLHGNNITHRDIKLENILVNLNPEKKIVDIKLADFGLARAVGENEMMKTMCGTPSYLAPEIFCNPREAQYTKSVDIWALGVVLYAMNTGEFPFIKMPLGGKIATETFLQSSQLVMSNELYASLSSELQYLIKEILEIDPNKRIEINDILMSEWAFSNISDLSGDSERIFIKKESWGTLISSLNSAWRFKTHIYNNLFQVGRDSTNDLVIMCERVSRISFILERNTRIQEYLGIPYDGTECVFITRKSKIPIWLNNNELILETPTQISHSDIITLVKKSPNNDKILEFCLNLTDFKENFLSNNIYKSASKSTKSLKKSFKRNNEEYILNVRSKQFVGDKYVNYNWVQLQPRIISCIIKNPEDCKDANVDSDFGNKLLKPWSQSTLIKNGQVLNTLMLYDSIYSVGRTKSKKI
ncbi:hypothetical protein BB561_005543 [Smittium simulii]|uniref:Protein kinase domain-containing protein n=1 Tax=Smittium simulii TaxID=133385 RepID=A0A2T9Y9V1_9FUNG|nr:hypothetical protein BB561_005543 [Smittium simulii]